MANESSENGKTREGVASHPQRELPKRLARLINPNVMAESRRKAAARAGNESQKVVLRQRYIEIITDHLLGTI